MHDQNPEYFTEDRLEPSHPGALGSLPPVPIGSAKTSAELVIDDAQKLVELSFS